MKTAKVIIVGAGPAGVRAAETLVKKGIQPTVVDEAPQSGGQIYRRPPPAIARNPGDLYGFEAGRATAIHRAFDDLQKQLDYRPETLVWDVEPGRLHTVSNSSPKTLEWDRLIVATGAMDRVIPFKGWTLPGVFTLGGAQAALKQQACVIGERPVFFGTGPLLYLIAHQYAAAGVKVAAVLDTAPAVAKPRAVPGLLNDYRTFVKGLYSLARLHLRGIPVVSGVRPVEVLAGKDGGVSGFTWRGRRGKEHRTVCDSLAIGFGLQSETQLADLCGVPFTFDRIQRQWLPSQNSDGRADLDVVYFAGDCGPIRGAYAAELSGARAAHALLFDLGHTESAQELERLNKSLARFERVRVALHEKAFPFPYDLAAQAADDLMICRCEGITAGALRHAAGFLGVTEMTRAKAFTRVGMGRCQGRICGTPAAEVLANALNVPVDRVGRLRAQAPIKPVALGAFLNGDGS